MRHLHALNLVCFHRNLRIFDAQRRIISHQRSGLFVRVWRVWNAYGERMYVPQAHVCGTRACVALACAHVYTRHDPRTCKIEMLREKWYISCLLHCNRMLLLCIRI